MKTALVLGGADCLESDMEKALSLIGGQPDIVVACNEAGYMWPGHLDAWVTVHARFFTTKRWREERSKRELPQAQRHVGHHEAVNGQLAAKGGLTDDLEVSHYSFPGQTRCGSSGMFALKYALVDLGADRAIMCGIPMTQTPHFFDPKNWTPGAVRGFRRVFKSIPEQYLPRIRSVSGWTREQFGGPEDWYA